MAGASTTASTTQILASSADQVSHYSLCYNKLYYTVFTLYFTFGIDDPAYTAAIAGVSVLSVAASSITVQWQVCMYVCM